MEIQNFKWLRLGECLNTGLRVQLSVSTNFSKSFLNIEFLFKKIIFGGVSSTAEHSSTPFNDKNEHERRYFVEIEFTL